MSKLILRSFLIAAACVMIGAPLQAQQPDLVTRWATEVSPDNALPAYPRPQMVRDAWLNLNGLWQYALTGQADAQPADFDGDILVPFPIESALSGVQQRADDQRLWYRRTVTIPDKWSGGRVLLHFGAVDWETVVWVNGVEAGSHRGGYDSFTFDITDALTAAGEQEIVVAVWDPTDAGTQPRGKQVRQPESIWYTPTTGIWQTVWLEAVPQAYISDVMLTPDIDSGTLTVTADIEGDGAYTLVAEAQDGTGVVATTEGDASDALTLMIDNPNLWSPEFPFLYDLTLQLRQGETVVDEIGSYFGMRKIALGQDDNGDLRLLLNNEPLFQFGPLDQGFWPDGLYTAPTDEALRYDIEVTRQLGFNTIRKHVKVEPERWYYWADKLGVLVWQDMPSGDNTLQSAAQFELELQRLVETHRNHPSIVMWVPFNESWGQYDTVRLVEWLQELDPTRLVNNASGWDDMGAGDVLDIHSYPGPDAPAADRERASVLGEFGGLGLPLAGHTWQDEANWGYRQFNDADSLRQAYGDLITALRVLIEKRGLAAAIYTQTTDVEIEVNGMMTYDRDIVKMGIDAVHDINQLVYQPLPQVVRLVPTSELEGVPWQYTTEEPGDDWAALDFEASDWADGVGGFGKAETSVEIIRTEWAAPQVWLRHEFTLENPALSAPYLRVHHIGDVEIYLNGELIIRLPLSTEGYVEVRFPDEAMSLLQSGENVLALHAFRPSFGPLSGDIEQYIDAGLFDTVRAD